MDLRADPHWYRSAFGPLASAFWTALIPAERVEHEARFLASALEAPAGGELLDVPCGAGRHARALGRMGFRVTGIDLSPDMLAAASGEGAPEGVTLRAGEMDRLEESARFDGAYCWGNSFGYLDHEGNRAFLRGVARALKPRARFVLEAPSLAECLLPALRDRTEVQVGGFRFSALRRYDMSESALHVAYRIEREGAVEEFVARTLVYTAGELARMAWEVGLAEVKLLGGLDDEEAAPGKPAIAIFRRDG
ncbi:MAG TPA: class I SAM-dependent methyltransferase [Myxococcales bacterium]|nr:class I SAM-dependent methyltransferase [Myxococcales bacterium]